MSLHSSRFAFAHSALALVLAVGACAPDPRVGTATQPIINGVPSGPDDDEAIAIGIAPNGQIIGFCSGVLVAENLVLTARHCVSEVADGGIACDINGNPISGGAVGADYRPQDLKIFVGTSGEVRPADAVGKLVLHPDANNLCNMDIAAIVLDRSIAKAKLAPIRLDTKPTVGELIKAVGWGLSNTSNAIQRNKRDNIPIISVGPDDQSTQLPVGPNELAIGEGICEGDSGGPALDETSGAVIAVVSRGGNGMMPNPNNPVNACVDSGGYITQNLYTRTDAFKAFILDAFNQAGATPWYEGQPDPRLAKFGEACSTGADCQSNACLSASDPMKPGMCTQTCDAQNMCPSGFSCQDKGGEKVCATGGCGCDVGGVPPSSSLPGMLLLAGVAGALLLVQRRRRA